MLILDFIFEKTKLYMQNVVTKDTDPQILQQVEPSNIKHSEKFLQCHEDIQSFIY